MEAWKPKVLYNEESYINERTSACDLKLGLLTTQPPGHFLTIVEPLVKGEAKDQQNWQHCVNKGPAVQSVISLTSLLRVISLTILADSIHNILTFFIEKMSVAFALQKLSYSHFFSKKFQHICVLLD